MLLKIISEQFSGMTALGSGGHFLSKYRNRFTSATKASPNFGKITTNTATDFHTRRSNLAGGRRRQTQIKYPMKSQPRYPTKNQKKYPMKTQTKYKKMPKASKPLAKPTRHPDLLKPQAMSLTDLRKLDKTEVKEFFKLDKKYKKDLEKYEKRKLEIKEYREKLQNARDLFRRSPSNKFTKNSRPNTKNSKRTSPYNKQSKDSPHHSGFSANMPSFTVNRAQEVWNTVTKWFKL